MVDNEPEALVVVELSVSLVEWHKHGKVLMKSHPDFPTLGH